MAATQKLPSRTGILIRTLIILFVGGMVNSAAVFVNPLAQQYAWSTESVAGVITFMATMQTPGHILSGWMLGKVGAKKTLIIGCVLLGLAFLLSGLVPADSPWLLYLTFSVLQGLGVGFTYTGATYCATGWYPDKLGLAAGLCMAFNGGSATFLAPLVGKLIQAAGIISTLYIVGGGILVIGIVSAIGLRTAPAGYIPEGWTKKASTAGNDKIKAAQLESLTPSQVVRTRAYWHLFLGMGLFPTLYIICYPRFAVLISDAGYSAAAATLGISLYSISNVVSRLIFGALIDKIGYRKVYTLCGALCIGSAVCLMFANSLFMFYAAYILLAFGFGPTNSCHPVAIQSTFGPKYAGGIFGLCMLGYMLICTIISPRISSAMVASTGSYTASMIFAIVACVAAVAVYTTIPMPKRRSLAEVEAEEASKK